MLVAGTFHCVVVSLSSTRLNVSLHYILLHSKLFRDISTSLNILPFRQHSQPIRKEGTSVCQAKAPAQQAVRGTLGAQISPRSKWQIDIALAYHWHSCLSTYRPIGLSLLLLAARPERVQIGVFENFGRPLLPEQWRNESNPIDEND